MPELKRLFTSGKMNKDLDERLVPNGQYRDAQNIQVSDSEGSDVGAIESVLGNTKRNKKSNSANDVWQANFGLTNPACIGVARDTLNNKVYWFITSDSCDAILEYDESTEFIAPVLVDSGSVLDFNKSNLITGVNVFEGLLAWTDDRNEPRIIKVDTFKSATTTTIGSGRTLSGVTTSIYGRSFLASDITVIKQKPNAAPTLTLKSTLKTGSGLGCGVNQVNVDVNFAITEGSSYRLPDIGDTKIINFKGSPDWAVNDIILFSASKENDENFLDEYFVRAQVNNIQAVSGPPATSNITVEILSISQNTQNVTYTWEVVLEEEPPLFEDDFPRFAYRWRYNDNRYSPLSPFSSVAFIGDSFDFTPYKGINRGMTNYVRSVELSGFSTAPKDVEKIEILYKDTSSNNIYKVDEIDITETTFDIESKIFGAVIPSNQLLRPYDNVPRKAKSQELIGNRLVYGNYVQNFDLLDGSSKITPALSTSVTSTAHNSVGDPKSSVKTMRNYQLGVVYLDDYGRETPVFTSTDAAILVPKSECAKTNKLRVDITTEAPDFATHYKIVVKETSNEYYNLVLDRFYKAEDGNVWLSFPSAERNKVSENQFIHLKKEIDVDEAVTTEAKFRILDISNEAPTDVVNRLVRKGSVYARKRANSSDDNENITIRFAGPKVDEDEQFYHSFRGGNYLRLINKNSNDIRLARAKVTDLYEIAYGGPTGEIVTISSTEYAEYSVTLAKDKESDFDWYDDLADDTGRFTFLLYQYERSAKSEYQGKFFAKINKDHNFDEYILQSLFEENPLYDYEFSETADNSYPADYDSNDDPPILVWGTKPSAGSNTMSIKFGYSGDTSAPYNGDLSRFFNYSLSPGKYIYFEGDGKEEYYKVSSISDSLSAANSNGDYEVTRTVTFDRNIVAGTTFSNYNMEGYRATTDWNKYLDERSKIFGSSNPAVFETQPLETAELDVYYDATDNRDISNHGTAFDLDWFNCYSFGNGVESDRINDDFNARTIGKGVKANASLDIPYFEERKGGGMIYSGIFNSTSGFNQLNQFIAAEKITKDLNPIYGSIQKLHARDTDLVVLLEDKIFRVLANKDALYNADGNANLTATNRVLGQATPYVGEYGISKNPESFASYGFRAYFTDKARGAVIRLSRDGITEISSKGMSDYILDAYRAHDIDQIYGSYDEDAGAYNVRLNGEVLSFKENVDGWATRLSYEPEGGISLNNEYYTFNNGEIYIHNNTTRSNFYGTQYDTTVTLLHNDQPSRIKNFKTLSYEGDDGWTATVDTDQQDGEVATWKNKEGIYYNYIRGLDSTWSNSSQSGTLDTSEFNVQGIDEAETVSLNADQTVWTIRFANDINVSLQAWVDGAEESDDKIYFVDASDSDKVHLIGTCRDISGNTIKVNKDTTAVPAVGDFIFFAKNTQVNTSGIIGYYASVKMTKTGGTNKELFAVNSEIFISS